eukprot:scaffold1068_cov167-Amphora_coffeaeformis.AAC.27
MPSSESSPLISQVNQTVSGWFTAQNVQRAQAVAHERAAVLRTSIETGHCSLRLLVLLGGVGVILSAVFGFTRDLIFFNFSGALLELYTLLLGCIIMVLESRQLSLPPAYLQKVLKYALFLKYIWGRGLLYSFAGTLQATQGSLMDTIVGVYLMFVGIAFIGLGYMTAQKLASVGRREFSTSILRSKFNAADTNRSGKIDLEQFSALVDDFEFPLSPREKEVAFLYLDTSDHGELTFEEFQAWFHKEDAAPIL